MAHAEVEERQLLKAMTWWDGFVVALANPGFLIAALGASIGALGTTGAFVLWTISITLGALQNNIHAELAGDVPEQVRRHRALRPRGVAQVPHADRPARDLRLLDRLVGRARRSTGSWPARSSRPSGSRTAPGPRTPAPSTCRLPIAIGIGLHHRRLALQRLRRAAGGLVRLPDRRAAAHPGVRADVPALHHGRLVEQQHGRGTSAPTAASRSRSSGSTSCAGPRTGSRWWPPSLPSTTTPSATPPRRCARLRCSPASSTSCCRSAWAARSARRPWPRTARSSRSTRPRSTRSSARASAT